MQVSYRVKINLLTFLTRLLIIINKKIISPAKIVNNRRAGLKFKINYAKNKIDFCKRAEKKFCRKSWKIY